MGPFVSLCTCWGGWNLDPKLGHALCSLVTLVGHMFFDDGLALLYELQYVLSWAGWPLPEAPMLSERVHFPMHSALTAV